MSIIDIKEYEYMGYNLYYKDNKWTITETSESFETSQEAESYIKNGLKKTTEAQRKAVRDYEKNNYRLNLVLPKGTKERIEALNLNKSNSAFIRDTVLAKLDELEKILK